VKVIAMDREGMLTKQMPTFSEGHESKQMLLFILKKENCHFTNAAVWSKM
jgi:hypothetical protein